MSVYAIIIGVNHYTAPESYGLKSLNGAINDAQSIADWLKASGHLEEKNLYLLTSQTGLESVLKQQIDDAIAKINLDILENGINADRLYFYFAGHGFGVSNDIENSGLCMSNWSRILGGAASLSSSDYKRKFLTEGHFKEVVIWLDCCRDTPITETPGSSSGITTRGNNTNPKLFFAYSTQYQNAALEAVTNATEKEYRGVFTQELLKGLNGAAVDVITQKVTSESLANYLYINVPITAQALGFSQTPEIFRNTSPVNGIIFK